MHHAILKISLAALVAAVGESSIEPAPAASTFEGSSIPRVEAEDLNIADLTEIEWEPGTELPESVRALNGRRFVIGGYMHQSITEETNSFPLVSEACQCTGLLMPHHFVEVNLGPRKTDPLPGRFEVIGTLSVSVVEEDGFITSVYRLRGRIY